MSKSIESKIRLNVVLLYFLIALVCGGFVFFFYSLSEQLKAQKTTYEEYYAELSVANNLTQAINLTQIEANLYIYTRNTQHLNNFRNQIKYIEYTIDSLRNIYQLQVDSIWSEISVLLKVKENSIMALNRQLVEQDEIIVLKNRSFNNSIKEIENQQAQDTIIQGTGKKNFWERVANVFNPNEKTDTVIVTKQEQQNIIQEHIDDTDYLVKNLKKTQANYNRRINIIEEQIKKLVVADQEISSKISDSLIQMNTQIIHSRWDELLREEVQLRKSNKDALWLGIAALILVFIFIILIITDVNKGQALRKALEEASRKNREIMESRHKLLLSVSHDIKTPLNSILGYLEISQQKNHLAEKEIASMQNSGKHILSLLSNLLEFSSLEQGKVRLGNSSFSLNELCDELYEMFALLAKTKNLSFTCEKDFDPSLILYSDSLKIKQILTNILSNAIKYTPQGSVNFKVSYKKNTLTLIVNDTGAGIPKDKLDSIYKPFTRIDENNSLAEGSGFGMYVVKGLVSLFHGKIQYQSKVGEGTTVSVNLSVEKGEAKAEDHTLKTILLIDDDDVFINMVRRMCTLLGHQATSACKTWDEFEEKLPEISTFDIVLVDMEMTNFTGQDILARIKECNLQIPVFLMTGRMDYNTQLAQSEGFTDYIGKPMTLKRLHLLIGGNLPNEEENVESFLGDKTDKHVIQVIEEFLFSAINHLVDLRKAVEQDDFEKAQSICHTMRPMCVQLNADEKLTSVMSEMDSFRNRKVPKTYRWQEKILLLADGLEDFLSKIQEEYWDLEND